MNDLRTFFVSFCIVCVTFGAVTILFPEKRFNKILKLVLSLSLICSVLSAFVTVGDIDFSKFGNSNTQNYEDTTINTAKAIFETALKQNNINYKKITLITDKNETGSIIISKIIVYSNDSLEKILSAIGNSENYEVEVVNE